MLAKGDGCLSEVVREKLKILEDFLVAQRVFLGLRSFYALVFFQSEKDFFDPLALTTSMVKQIVLWIF